MEKSLTLSITNPISIDENFIRIVLELVRFGILDRTTLSAAASFLETGEISDYVVYCPKNPRISDALSIIADCKDGRADNINCDSDLIRALTEILEYDA